MLSQDVGMEFGAYKWAVLVMKPGKLIKSEGIKWLDVIIVNGLKEDDSYKYPRLLEEDKIKYDEMKEILQGATIKGVEVGGGTRDHCHFCGKSYTCDLSETAFCPHSQTT